MNEVLYFLNFTIFKIFCDVRCTNEPIDLWWMNGELRILNNVLVTNWVSRFVAYGRENFENNRILMYDGCFWFHWIVNAKERVQERKLLRDSHVHFHETQSVHKLGWEIGWTHSLLSLAFTTQWNQKHSSYVSIRLLAKFHLAALARRADYMRCLKLMTSWVMFWS